MGYPPSIVGPVVDQAVALLVEGVVPLLQVKVETSDDPSFPPGPATLSGVTAAATARATVPLNGLSLRAYVRVGQSTTTPVTTDWSPAEPVHPVSNAAGIAKPAIPWTVYDADDHVLVIGAVPGCEVVVEQDGVPIGEGIGGPDLTACVPLYASLKVSKGVAGDLQAYVIVGGVPGPPSPSVKVLGGSATPGSPSIAASLLPGQQGVWVRGLAPRGVVEILVEDGSVRAGDVLGVANVCQPRAFVPILPLLSGESIFARQTVHGSTADSAPVLVALVPDWRITRAVCGAEPVVEEGALGIPVPKIRTPVRAGDSYLYVDGLVPGAVLTVVVQPPLVPIVWAARHEGWVVGEDNRIPVPSTLYQDFELSIEQTLKDISGTQLVYYVATSAAVTVVADPPTLATPVLIPQLFDCGRAMLVVDVEPGSIVRAWQDDKLIGQSGINHDGHVHLQVMSLEEPLVVEVDQTLGATTSPRSAGVAVQPGHVFTPRLVDPLLSGEDQVLVSGVIPGALVRIADGDDVIGYATPAEGMARVPVRPATVNATLVASQVLCDVPYVSEPKVVALDPGLPGPYATADTTATGDVYFGPAGEFHGSMYWPVDASGAYFYAGQDDPPLVIIHHGDPPTNTDPAMTALNKESHRGYDYLGTHLASHGIVVISVQGARDAASAAEGLDILDAIKGRMVEFTTGELATVLGLDPASEPFAGSPVGLVGHSVGGGLVLAMDQQNTQPDRGVVAIFTLGARYGQAIYATQTPSLHIAGTLDYASMDASFIAFHQSIRPKTFVWARRAEHNGYNTVWSNWLEDPCNFGSWSSIGTPDHVIAHVEDSDGSRWPGPFLGTDPHQRIAKAYGTSFFLHHLSGLGTPGGGSHAATMSPPSLRDLALDLQHLSNQGPERRDWKPLLQGGPIVVSTFGNPDPQLGVVADTSDVNAFGLPNQYSTTPAAVDNDAIVPAIPLGSPGVSAPDREVPAVASYGWDVTGSMFSTSLPVRLGAGRGRLLDNLSSEHALQLRIAQGSLTNVLFGGSSGSLDALHRGEPLDVVFRVTDINGNQAYVSSRAEGQVSYPDVLEDRIVGSFEIDATTGGLTTQLKNDLIKLGSLPRSVRARFDALKSSNPLIRRRAIQVVEILHPSVSPGRLVLHGVEIASE